VCEALAQIGDRGVRHVQREWFGLPAHDISTSERRRRFSQGLL
jgi:hypothetical protein